MLSLIGSLVVAECKYDTDLVVKGCCIKFVDDHCSIQNQ